MKRTNTIQTQARPEERRYFLPVYGRTRNWYFLCQHKHETVSETVDCLKQRGISDPKIEIHEVLEKRVYDAHHIATYGPDGGLVRKDRFALLFANKYEPAYTDGFKDGSSMSVEEIESLISQEEARRKAARRAKRQANAEKKQARSTVEKGGAA